MCNIALLSALLCSAQRNADVNRVADAVLRIQNGNIGTGPVDAASYVQLAARAGVRQVVPDLERLFSVNSDPEMRAVFASALVRLRDNDDRYWLYLVDYAKPALRSTAPTFIDGPDGQEDVSASFRNWAKKQNLTVEKAHQDAFEVQLRLVYLAKAGDARAIPILRPLISSRNYDLAVIAANGLAESHDEGAVSLIITLCDTAPVFQAHNLAFSLVFFDDLRAAAAARKFYLPPGSDLAATRQFVGHPFMP